MTARHVLLLAPFGPSNVLNGTVVELRKYAAAGAEQLTWVHLGTGARNATSDLPQVALLQRPAWRRPYSLFSSHPGYRLRRGLWSEVVARDLARLARTEDIDRIWAIAVQFVPRIACRLSALADLPLHVTVHDHPYRRAQDKDCDRPTWYWREVQRECEDLFRAADSIDVISRRLKEYVENIATCPVKLVLPKGRNVPTTREQNRSDMFRIGFNGNVHAGAAEVRAFLTWLSAMDKPFEFHVFGERAFPREELPRLLEVGEVVHHEYEPDYDKYVNSLAQMDAFYVGARFSPEHDLMARYSFPSKITAILTAGVPLICHGPDYWELNRWLAEIGFGVSVGTVDGTTVPAALSEFISSADKREKYRKGASEMYEKHLKLAGRPEDNKLPWETHAA
jgi:hypothetical protein